MTRRVFNLSLPIVFPDGTMQVPFREFIRVVDEAINSAALTGSWGSLTGTLSNQTDLQAELDGKATTAQGALADTSLQPGDDVSELINDAGYLTAYAPPAVRNEATTPYTLVIGDANAVLRFTAANAAVTIPAEAAVAFPVGTELRIRQAGTGTLVLTTTGLTINGTLPTWAQHTEAALRKVGADEWDVTT